MAHLPHPSRAAVVAALGCGVLAASTLGVVTTANANTVSLSLDGEVNQVRTNATSVAEVLEDEGIDVTSRDVVTPSLDAAVQDGEVIAVRYARQVTLVVDGVERTIWTVADDVAEALSVLGLRDKRMELSVSRSMGIGRDGARLEVSTPKRVTLVVDGKSQKLVTTAVDVDELLDDEGFAVGAKDKVNAEPDDLLAAGDKIVLKRTVAKTKTQNVSVGYSTVRRSDSSMYKGTSKTLRAGRNGKAVQQVRIVTFGGDEKSHKVVKRTVTRKPVSAIVAVGTKSRPVSSAPSVSGGSTWDALARCESGGNWAINTGNGYYGGLQFSLSTWRAFGGGSYASYPHQASRAQQIAIATKTRDAAGGYSPWPSCSRKLGLR